MTEVALDQAAGLRRLLARGVPRTITIASAAAGAGRSLITANLAVALARRGRGVLVLDCTSGRGSAGWLLGALPGSDVLEAAHGITPATSLVAQGVAGVRVVQAGALLAGLARLPEASSTGWRKCSKHFRRKPICSWWMPPRLTWYAARQRAK